jgi:ATP-dependent DNA helicase RecQ
MYSILKKHFGYDSFRPPQDEIIATVMGGKDAFVLMPTGGGKSLCFQLPALMLPGLTLVISPLIALMKDQVDSLRANGIAAEFINSSLSDPEIDKILARIEAGEIKLLYVAPERFALTRFQDFLERIEVSLLAVDEAHCISEWGHDFRPDYRHLSQLKKLWPAVPLIALTATATPKVREDIIRHLGISRAQVFVSSFDRPNLRIDVTAKKDAFRKLIALLDGHKGQSVIIYCHSRKETEELADNLRSNSFNAIAYHAGLENEKRRRVQELFIKDKVDIICATIAFGMGIDKPDVRLVVHYTYPKTLESYYQEIGRAGRDGLPSRCVLFYTYADTRKHEFFLNRINEPKLQAVAQEKLSQVLDFCELMSCRKRFLLSYFSEEMEKEACGACDVCLSTREEFDASDVAKKIMSAILRTGSRFGRNYIVDVLLGKDTQKIKTNGHNKLSVFGLLKNYDQDALMDISKQLINQGLLTKSDDSYPIIKLSRRGADFLNQNGTIILKKPEAKPVSVKKTRSGAIIGFDNELFQILRQLRRSLAEAAGVAPFIIFGDKTLMEMAYFLPLDQASFLRISGVGQKKLDDFGQAFLGAIQEYANKNQLKTKMSPEPKTRDKEIIFRSERPKFHQKTKELILKKTPIDRIAKHQGLSLATVINHLEKLIDAGEKLDLEYLKLPKDRYQAMSDAFAEIGDERLKPVFEHLAGKYSYDELRLVRVLLLA